MCYRCGYCNVVVAHKTPMRRHVKYKRDPILGNVQIAKEIPVCKECLDKIGYGEKPQTVKKFVAFLPPKPKPSEVVRSVSVAKVGVNKFKNSAETGRYQTRVPNNSAMTSVQINGNKKK